MDNTNSDQEYPKIVKAPPHYTQGDIEPIDFIESQNMSFNQGNIIKYVTRYKYKNGLEDLHKARFYLDRLIAHQEEGDKVLKDIIDQPIPTEKPDDDDYCGYITAEVPRRKNPMAP